MKYLLLSLLLLPSCKGYTTSLRLTLSKDDTEVGVSATFYKHQGKQPVQVQK